MLQIDLKYLHRDEDRERALRAAVNACLVGHSVCTTADTLRELSGFSDALSQRLDFVRSLARDQDEFGSPYTRY